jgi:hypothetical protein
LPVAPVEGPDLLLVSSLIPGWGRARGVLEALRPDDVADAAPYIVTRDRRVDRLVTILLAAAGNGSLSRTRDRFAPTR